LTNVLIDILTADTVRNHDSTQQKYTASTHLQSKRKGNLSLHRDIKYHAYRAYVRLRQSAGCQMPSIVGNMKVNFRQVSIKRWTK